MRSRYAAYAKHLPDYIIETTHPQNQGFMNDRAKWVQSILQFSKHTQFVGLDILNFSQQGEEGYVTFIAHLLQNGQDVSFEEKSHFQKINDRWLYLEGIYLNPYINDWL